MNAIEGEASGRVLSQRNGDRLADLRTHLDSKGSLVEPLELPRDLGIDLAGRRIQESRANLSVKLGRCYTLVGVVTLHLECQHGPAKTCRDQAAPECLNEGAQFRAEH